MRSRYGHRNQNRANCRRSGLDRSLRSWLGMSRLSEFSQESHPRQVPIDGGEETPVRGLEPANLGRDWALTASGGYYIPQTSDALALFYLDFA
jgi:hypothetical protein